jgi:hypothetical protein
MPQIIIKEVPANSVTISLDEYMDLQSARTRLDVISDVLTTETYADTKRLLVIARGIQPNQPPLNEPGSAPTASEVDK